MTELFLQGRICPHCGLEGKVSYYGCDTEPYPFKGSAMECHDCNVVWDTVQEKESLCLSCAKAKDICPIRKRFTSACVEYEMIGGGV